MSDDDARWRRRSVVRRVSRRMEDATRAPYVKGLPEWDMFPDEASRRVAIEEIERGMMPRSIKDVLNFLLAVIIFLSAPAIIAYLITHYLLFTWPWRDHAFWIMTIAGYTAVVYLGLRRDMPKALREQLIKCGVPVCLKCGYDLRGLPPDRARCPECGRDLDQKVAELVRKAAAGCKAP